ncbi:transposase [Pedobacter sp. W3I1]|uniref:IS110 family transposase n=1 Tax=Pedobacter sp. W3I1 TaxID=3042291 RepID=UPI002781D2ED|nr:IS110 family transposase [Pedobacter sp. W3I1]MDQ0637481.1 transposase [Pedobacter sp. W3I1]MDQ0639650.1 transposase [Pedobacter sp. W3I1]MDQ0639944.1 transposase [Pedobacter sp. W3I1]
MEIIHNNSAGIDIGSRNIYISPGYSEVKVFGTFTGDFRAAASYLIEKGTQTIAMEATGSYWVILYDILVEHGFDVWLVDGRQTRQVPGRKTDVKDCQWIQQLHSYGLLNRCFVAQGELKEVRGYQRLREDHLRSASMHINHMQKAMIEMNIRLPEVLDQIQGASGISIIHAILEGERDPHRLLSLCHGSILKKKSAEILAALEGFYTERGLFALRQAYQAYQFYQMQIRECDAALNDILCKINQDKDHREAGPRKPVRHHKPQIDELGRHMLDLFGGRDATVLPGITDYSWLQIYSETGTDLERWPSEKHFTSWLGLSPGQNHSGKANKRPKKKGRPNAGQIFRLLAQSLLKSKKISFGAFGRRLKGRKGPMIAIKAVARKIAVQYWRLMVKGQEFVDQGVANYEAVMIKQKEKYLKKLALELNLQVIDPK